MRRAPAQCIGDPLEQEEESNQSSAGSTDTLTSSKVTAP